MKSLITAPRQSALNSACVPAWHLQRRPLGPRHDSGLEAQGSIENQAPLLQRQAMIGGAKPESGEAPVTLKNNFHFSSVPIYPPGFRPKLMLQRKLMVNTQGDAHEQEADRVADQVIRMPGRHLLLVSASKEIDHATAGGVPSVQRKCACGGVCADCNAEHKDKDDEHAHVQMKAEAPGSTGLAVAPPIVHEVLRSSGRPLDPGTRAFMEPRFGHDFSQVRVHTDAKAADSAQTIQAQAYTVGNSVVFGPGRFAPETIAGKRLLGHELAHVIQQGGLSNPTHLQRQPSPDDKKKKEEEEKKKQVAVNLHKEQQKHVAVLLDDARKIKTDPSQPTAINNIFRNVIELLDAKKMTLTILTPTHYSTKAKPAYFDARVAYPKIEGDYIIPSGGDPGGGPGIDRPDPGEAGATRKVPPPVQISTLPPKVEVAPGQPAPAKPAPAAPPPAPPRPWSTADVALYLETTPVTKDELRDTLSHEGVHVADWSHLHAATLQDSKSILEEYKTEFRAYWAQDRFTIFADEPIRGSQNDVTIPPDRKCVACPAPATPGSIQPIRMMQTNLQNKKQAEIFRMLMSNYTAQQFDCFYVCDPSFKKEVDKFHHPAGENLIASARIVDLKIELRKLNPAMTRDQISKTDFLKMVENLDALDWAFLQDNSSQPFWDLMGSSAPKPFSTELQALAKKGQPKIADVDQAWQRAFKKLK